MKPNIIRTVTWRFHDSASIYPHLTNQTLIISSPEDFFKHFLFLFQNQVKERFVVVWLNSCNKVSGFEIVTEGLLNSSLVHPREVFRGAIVATAASIIIAHNHPSGNAVPSQEDIAITKQLVESSKILGIPLHDHVIITNNSYHSMAEHNQL